ncbi:MAG: M48 family metallopeptidase [Bacilli bacterium]|nr:M48 family metallopeptidase [Bacilli bacterium]
MKFTIENNEYTFDGKVYPVVITRKRMKNVTYRFRSGTFYVSAPKRVALSFIIKGLDKFGPNLIKRSAKATDVSNEYVYIFGERYPINNINIDNKILDYSDQKNYQKELYKMLYNYVYEKTYEYGALMGININTYRVKVRNTRSRFGSNSRRTYTIAYSFQLVHFSKEIIDSVIYHELAHCKVFNHSKSFYDIVYQYCPNYNELRKKLIHAEHK